MKIAEIRLHILSIPHKGLYHWALGAPEGSNVVLVEVVSDEGLVGYGDACGARSAAAVAAASGISSTCSSARTHSASSGCWSRCTDAATGRMSGASSTRRSAASTWPSTTCAARPSACPRTTSSAGGSSTRSPGSPSSRATRPRSWRRTRSEYVGARLRSPVPQDRRGAGARRRDRGGRAGGGRARSRACGSTRTRRGIASRRSGWRADSQSSTSTGCEQPTPFHDIEGAALLRAELPNPHRARPGDLHRRTTSCGPSEPVRRTSS